jgi:hypothetical protein
MYKIHRFGNRVSVEDWKGLIVYSADSGAILLYRGADGPRTALAGTLTDEQLLIALATAIKLAL